MQKLVSICIPAYKRTTFLKRLLDSIAIQTFKNFEVIVTDDSPDNDVKQLCDLYNNKFTLFYYRNIKQLGTPENWNEAIRKSNTEWIKIMHDDDWFTDENSLNDFINAIEKNSSASFIFSAYKNVFINENETKDIFINAFRYKMLCKNPVTLFSQNVIGPPSCVIFKKNNILFDNKLQWVVDFDFYIRYLFSTKPIYIKKALVNIGINETQVTQRSFGKPEIEIPENFLLLEKVGSVRLENILVFDAWWRLIRNLKIKNIDYIKSFGYNGDVPKQIISIIKFQNKFSESILNIGIISKLLMLLCFCNSRLRSV